MNAFLSAIGAFVTTLIALAIPICCGLSFALHWFAGIQFILVILSGIEGLILFNYLLERSDDDTN